jgi:hypothetical protein
MFRKPIDVLVVDLLFEVESFNICHDRQSQLYMRFKSEHFITHKSSCQVKMFRLLPRLVRKLPNDFVDTFLSKRF